MRLIDTLSKIRNPINFIQEKKIERNFVLKVLEAARWAPSAENQQSWRFIVVSDKEKIDVLREAIREGDPRLVKRLSQYREPEEQELNKGKFTFTEDFFNSEEDSYKSDIESAHKKDIACSETTSCFIICCHSKRLTGSFFGETDMGAAIVNMIVEGIELGISTKWIRNFNRKILRDEFNIPKIMEIDAILGLGYMAEEEQLVSDFNQISEQILSLNLWDNSFKNPETNATPSIHKEYNISTIDAILDRRSIRNYHEGEEYKISPSITFNIIESGLNFPFTIIKPYMKILAINDPEILSKISRAAKIVFRQQPHAQQVPLIVTVGFEAKNSSAFYAKVDAGAAVQLMLLRAHSLGIGTCWIGGFSRKIAKEILNCPKSWHIPSLIVLGYAKDYPNAPPRIDMGKMAFENDWNNPIVKRRRSFFPKAQMLSLSYRAIKKPKTETILRDIDAGCKDQSFLLEKRD